MTEEPIVATTTAGEIASASTSASLVSNEALLERLELARSARRRYRLFVFATGSLWMGIPYVFMMRLIMHDSIFDGVSSIFVLMVAFAIILMVVPALTMLNQWFYQRSAKRWEQALLELANRGEERALGPLLEFMDMRGNGTATGWGSKRTLLVGALKTLLSRLTPEGFGTLSDKEVASMIPMLSLREPGIKEAVTGMLGRCGDIRALRSLRDFETRCRFVQAQKWNPMLHIIMASRKFNRTGILDKETLDFIRVAIADIAPRVDEEQRNAQLLRASSASQITSQELLRPANSDEAPAHSDQLLRPTDTIISTISTQTPTVEIQHQNNFNATMPSYQHNTLPPTETVTLKQQSGN